MRHCKQGMKKNQLKFLNGKTKGDHQLVNTSFKSRLFCVPTLPVFNMYTTAELIWCAGILPKTFLTFSPTALSKKQDESSFLEVYVAISNNIAKINIETPLTNYLKRSTINNFIQ